MLSFKEFLAKEEMLPGAHNDGNRKGNMPAIVGSDFSGSESFPSHLPKFDGPELLYPGIPKDTVKGKILKITTSRERCQVDVDMGEGRMRRLELGSDALRNWIKGQWKSTDDLVGRSITLHMQGHDTKGNPAIRYAELN
jgi:hypothetical protein